MAGWPGAIPASSFQHDEANGSIVMPYIQAALALSAPAPPIPAPAHAATDPAGRGGWVARHRHTVTPSGQRLDGDLWEEYRFECATRDCLDLPDVSLAEFRDMRDWTNRIQEDEYDDYWITEPDTDAPPYGRFSRWQ
jgi:hypothetical protein